MWHTLAHFFGFTAGDSNGSPYLFWSGAGSDLAYLSFLWGGIVLYRRSNCKRRWCWRLGLHDLTDPETGVTHRLCWRHHPDVSHKNLTRGRIAEIQRKCHLYAGDKPGRG